MCAARKESKQIMNDQIKVNKSYHGYKVSFDMISLIRPYFVRLHKSDIIFLDSKPVKNYGSYVHKVLFTSLIIYHI